MRPTGKDYEYDVDQCSVSDKALLSEFREKRSEWIDWLERDIHHNIWNQIASIMWNDLFYRSLHEARRYSSENSPTASANFMLRDFLACGWRLDPGARHL